MTKTKTSALGICALSLTFANPLVARTWTSADGEKTFEGEYVEIADEVVTVQRGQKNIRFQIEKLSEADIAYVREQAKASEKFRNEAVPKAIAGQLVKFEGGSLVSVAESKIAPEYYFLAYSASW